MTWNGSPKYTHKFVLQNNRKKKKKSDKEINLLMTINISYLENRDEKLVSFTYEKLLNSELYIL